MKNSYLEKLTMNIKNIPYDYDKSLNGFGGWMAVFIIGHFLSILAIISGTVQLSDYRGFNEQIDTLINISIVLAIVELILVIIVIYLIFKRNILFRKIFVIRVVVSIAFAVGLEIYIYTLFGTVDSTQILYSIVPAAIWVTYVYRSKRVKNTFIYPYCLYADDDANRAIDIENV